MPVAGLACTVYIYSMRHAPDTPSTVALQPVTLVRATPKGRGTVWALEHRFTSDERIDFDDGWGTLDQLAQAEQQRPETQILEEPARNILSGNDSPDIGFDLSINPYRGCEHGCIYC